MLRQPAGQVQTLQEHAHARVPVPDWVRHRSVNLGWMNGGMDGGMDIHGTVLGGGGRFRRLGGTIVADPDPRIRPSD